MDNQHRLIQGYRELSADDIQLINDIKTMGLQLEALTDRVEAVLKERTNSGEPDAYVGYYDSAVWYTSAVHDLKVGMMQLVRAIASPGGF